MFSLFSSRNFIVSGLMFRYLINFEFIFVYSVRKHSAAAAAAKSLLSCPTLCDTIDGSPAGSPIPGILQRRFPQNLQGSFENNLKTLQMVTKTGNKDIWYPVLVLS